MLGIPAENPASSSMSHDRTVYLWELASQPSRGPSSKPGEGFILNSDGLLRGEAHAEVEAKIA
jgi:hypothetical protein